MADEGVNIKLRVTGGRAAARDAKQVGDNVGRIGKQARHATGGLRVFTRASTSAAGGMRLATGAVLTGTAAIGGGLVVELKRSVDAWQESRKVTAQTEAVLRSTGGTAKVTADQVGELANRLSRKTGVDDEAIQTGSNLLLTFKKIRNEAGAGNDVFNRATAAAVDLSAAGFGSIDSAAKQMGKALNDPIKGITALGRAGVTFTQRQKDQIKTLVDTGQVLDAQKIILREVESQVGGSAAKQATAIDRVKVSWGNIEETIGKGVSPAVDAVAGDLDKFLVKVTPQVDALGKSLGAIFGDKSTTFNTKMDLAGKAFAPLRASLGRELDRMNLGTRLADAVDAAGPRIADAAGRNAGRAVKAFISAWWHSDISGKLFTAALIGSKLGVFSSLGATAANRFTDGWKRTGKTPTRLPTGPPGGGSPGTAIAATLGVEAASRATAKDLKIGPGQHGWRRLLGDVTGANPAGIGLQILGSGLKRLAPTRAVNSGPVRTGNHIFYDDGRAPTRVPGARGGRGGHAQTIVVQVSGREIARAVTDEASNARARRGR